MCNWHIAELQYTPRRPPGETKHRNGPPIPSCIHYTVYHTAPGSGKVAPYAVLPARRLKEADGIRCNAYSWRDGSTIAAMILPTPRLLWRRGVGNGPDCHMEQEWLGDVNVGRPLPSCSPPPASSGGGGWAIGVGWYVGSGLGVM